ncbi:MAG: transcriptional regulator, MerR family [Planctomycetota bacterium]|nr:transcriptional regulator, MerR family [Planctomycetota bacterium]
MRVRDHVLLAVSRASTATKLNASGGNVLHPVMGLVRFGGDRRLSRDRCVTNLRDYLRISEAAEYLGVAPNTLRNWEKAGKIMTHRHPVNRYRLFRQKDLDSMLRQVERTARRGRPASP